jgi:hypothetical protein
MIGQVTHGLSKAPEYKVWQGMKQRCRNPRNGRYPEYGGRGITLCERWDSFEVFWEDMGPRPSPDHSIDRIDTNGNYEPGNCRWATRSEQQTNKRYYPAAHLPKGNAHWTRIYTLKAQQIGRANIAVMRGEANGRARLTAQQVGVIKARIVSGVSDVVIAREFSVRPGAIWFIRAGKHWKHVQ